MTFSLSDSSHVEAFLKAFLKLEHGAVLMSSIAFLLKCFQLWQFRYVILLVRLLTPKMMDKSLG